MGGLEGESGPWQEGELKVACTHSGRVGIPADRGNWTGGLGCNPALGNFNIFCVRRSQYVAYGSACVCLVIFIFVVKFGGVLLCKF